MARFEAILSSDDNTVTVLVDSDVFFNGPLAPILGLLGKSAAYVAGVPEFKNARDAYLLFRPPEYQHLQSSLLNENIIYQQIFGHSLPDTRLPQYNNGLLIFFKAKQVVKTWQRLYLRGLEYQEINPEDDQVSLAHAIKCENVKRVDLNKKFNSLGHLSGNYICFHAWAGQWREQLRAVICGKKPKTTVAEILQRTIRKTPPALLKLADFITDDDYLSNYDYMMIDGYFSFEQVYREALQKIHLGPCLEVGSRSNGRGTVFLAERLGAQNTVNRLYCLPLAMDESAMLEWQFNLSALELNSRFRLVNLNGIGFIPDNSLSSVLIDTTKHAECFRDLLPQLLKKLHPAGFLAGYDMTGTEVERDFHLELAGLKERYDFLLSFGKRIFRFQKK